MSRTGLAGIVLGTLATVLAIVNIVRVSRTLDSLEDRKNKSESKGQPAGASASGSQALTAEQRAAEVEYLKREVERISAQVEKARVEIANRAIGSGTGSNPGGDEPLPLNAADVAAMVESVMAQTALDAKVRENEARVAALERGVNAEMVRMEARLKLDAGQKGVIRAILETQVQDLAAVIRAIPPPPDRRERIEQACTKADEAIQRALTPEQLKPYSRSNKNWHGLGQKVDPKSERTVTPRDK